MTVSVFFSCFMRFGSDYFLAYAGRKGTIHEVVDGLELMRSSL